MFSVTLSLCDSDSNICGWSQNCDTLQEAQALFQEYCTLECYGGEPFDLFLEQNGVTLKDNF